MLFSSNTQDAKRPVVLQVGTRERGGIRSVIESYDSTSLSGEYVLTRVVSHDEESRLKTIGFFFWAFVQIAYYRVLGNLLCVHLHSAAHGSFWRKAMLICWGRLLRVPLVYHLHSSKFKDFYSALPGPLQSVVVWVLERAGCVIVLSDSWARYIQGIAPNARVEIIHNFVPVPETVAQRTGALPLNVLFLGIIGQRKGIYDLIDAVALLDSGSLPPVKFLIGGNGEVEKASAYAENKGVADYFEFLGWIGADSKANYLSRADLFVLPSYNEGLPMSLLEAMSWGVPVISTSVGGIPELVRDGVDGIIVDAGDLKGISNALIRMLMDEKLRIQMGSSARDRVYASFSQRVAEEKISALYKSFEGEVIR